MPANQMEASYDAERRRQLITGALVVAAVACLPLLIDDSYFLNVLILTLLYASLSQSWNILGGYCGQISLGHGMYFGIGAYITSMLYLKAGITPWVGMAAGAGASALVAMALGYPCFRLKGHYYSLATIVIAEIALLVAHNWQYVGAALGLQWPVSPNSWVTMQFGRDKVPYVILALGLFCLTWLVTWVIEASRWGYGWRAVKDNPEAAESLGVDIFYSKMAAAAISAAFTAAGGAFYAAFLGYIDPDNVMSFRFSLLFALPAVLGGIGTLWGPALGAAILIPVSEFTRSYLGGSGSGVDLIIYGALIVVIALARPEGLISLLHPIGRKTPAT